ncbi:MAG TPA: hypothetical protein VFA90_16200 [Terriglobales bacterium]|nr:hypothetical protein [Terriglobales bacterium]
MDLSKVKVEVYDFLAVIIPGLLVICEVWVTLRGWDTFAQSILSTSASGFTIVLLVAFATGTLLQELADVLVKLVKGERYFKAVRDDLWKSATGKQVNDRITQQLGHPVENVDVAFDYCLTRVQSSFAKRDLFLANADFARGLAFISWLGIAPLIRITNDLHQSSRLHAFFIISGLILLFLISCLGWSRMNRFREHSEKPVFHAYLAQCGETKAVPVKTDTATAN